MTAPHPHAELITTFYRAFARRDADAMVACYAPGVRFDDPVFSLSGWRAGAMWRMLCERGKDLRIEFRDVRADAATGSAHWDAWYTFSQTGRLVHNSIDATFTFAGGLIDSHRDSFPFHRWAGRALGLPGRLLGWTPPFHAAVRRRSAAALAAYIERRGLSETAT